MNMSISNQLILNKSQTLNITIDKDILDIVIEEHCDVILFLNIDKSCNITFNIKEGSKLKVFTWNNNEESKINIEFKLLDYAQCTFGLAEFTLKNAMYCIKTLLNNESNFECVNSIYSNSKVTIDIECTHLGINSTGIMKNFAVVGRDSTINIQDCGKIVKGAINSKSHQTTRVLTMDDPKSCNVIPLLLIDDNNVEASHAMTLGQPNEEQLYYMQTRGLSRNQALNLITMGYLLPIVDYIEDDKQKEIFKEKIESKVSSLCLI